MIRKIAILVLAISVIAGLGMQYTDASAHRWGGSLHEPLRGQFLLLLSTVLVGLTGLLVLARVFTTRQIAT